MNNYASSQEKLKDFLVYFAKNGYGNDLVEKVKEQDGSETIVIENGSWKAHDNYFTSEDSKRFHGRVVIFSGKKALWFCGYSGFVSDSVKPGEVYKFLRQALLMPQDEFPIRGPWEYIDDSWSYTLKADNSNRIEKFSAIEKISFNGETLYTGLFIGGDIS